MDVTLKTA